jgi:hypothetical protein
METHWPTLKDTPPSGKLCGEEGNDGGQTRFERRKEKSARERESALRTSKGSIDR